MALSDRTTLRAINDLIHDLTAGIFPGAVLALWLVRNGARATMTPQALSDLAQSWSWIVLLMFIALAIFVITGSIRVSYRIRNTKPEAVASQGRVALIKHAFFVGIFVYSAVVAFMVIQP